MENTTTTNETFTELVSFFKSSQCVEPKQQITLHELLMRIRKGVWAAPVAELRAMLAAGDKEGYDRAKRRLPAFCVSGACLTRDAEQTLEEKFIAHSGWLQVDLDKKDNVKGLANLDAVKAQMREEPHVGAYFVSPSGEGLKVLVRITPELALHKASFTAAEAHFRARYGLTIDRSVKDPLRLCFVSHDPLLWVRNNAEEAKVLPPLVEARQREPLFFPPSENTEADIAEMLSYIPATRPDYDTWLRIASAVWSVLPMEAGCRLLMAKWAEEKLGEYAVKYRNRLKQITVGTLVHYATQYGFDARAAAQKTRWCGKIVFADGVRSSAEVSDARVEEVVEAKPQNTLDAEFVRRCLDGEQHGDAALFAETMRGLLCYNETKKQWMRYNNGIWERDIFGVSLLTLMETCSNAYRASIDKMLAAMASEQAPAGKKDPRAKECELFRRRISSINHKTYAEAALHIAQRMLPSQETDYDKSPMLFSCENGTIDLQICEFREHRQNDRITRKIPVYFDVDAQCPEWEKFLARIFDNNAELIAYVQRAVGYSLSGDVNADKLFFLWGVGANGKSTFRAVIEMLLGEYCGNISIEVILEQKSDRNMDEQKTRLKGKRIMFSDEIPDNKKINAANLKSLTGGDQILARGLYENSFVFTPTHKLWVIGNHKPDIKTTDNGTWRRIALIPFTNTIPEAERVPRTVILERLRKEISGILNWALKGWVDFQKNGGLNPPQIVEEAVSEYRENQDQVGQFLSESFRENKMSKIKTGIIYEAYVKWCEKNGERPVCQTKKKLTMHFKEAGYDVTKDRNDLSVLHGYEFLSETPKLKFADDAGDAGDFSETF